MNNIVCSYNEWDPLEEVIVGSVIGAAKMAFEPSVSAYYRPLSEGRNFKGSMHNQDDIIKAQVQLDNFAKLLQDLGVIVKRPDAVNFFQAIKTPDFEIPCGNSTACPRDVLLVIGTEIIEAPMAQRGRYFEYRAYRSLIKDYFHIGASWTAAPKPLMGDQLYAPDYSIIEKQFDADTHPALTNFEPCFDAASFVRMGKDIFYQLDVVTNKFGAEWLKRHLGDTYRLHCSRFDDKHPPQHLDTTLVPLRPGIVMVNPERPCIDNTLELFMANGWQVISAPPSIQGVEFHSPEVSNWISMNTFSIDEKRVIVEEKEHKMIDLLSSLDFEVITCPFADVYKFGGGFHCCTSDIRRKGELRSYFPSLDVMEV